MSFFFVSSSSSSSSPRCKVKAAAKYVEVPVSVLICLLFYYPPRLSQSFPYFCFHLHPTSRSPEQKLKRCGNTVLNVSTTKRVSYFQHTTSLINSLSSRRCACLLAVNEWRRRGKEQRAQRVDGDMAATTTCTQRELM